MSLFFSQRKPRVFNYTPRFYDPEEESREERRKKFPGERYGSLRGSGEGEYNPGEYVRRSADARRRISEGGMNIRRKGKRPTLLPFIVMLALLALTVWILSVL